MFITHNLDEALRLGDRIAILRDGEAVQQRAGQKTVLKPVNDHIASFVKDVNRRRVIPCRTLITLGLAVEGPTADVSFVTEEAARRLSGEGADEANVTNAKGKLMGTISMSDIIAAMVSPNPESPP